MNNAAVTHSSSPFAIIDKIQMGIQRRTICKLDFLFPSGRQLVIPILLF